MTLSTFPARASLETGRNSLPVHGDAMLKDEVASLVVNLGRAAWPQQSNGPEP